MKSHSKDVHFSESETRWVVSRSQIRVIPRGSKVHEIIAAIAETHLTDIARKRIKELIPQATTLADASTWPDKAGRQIPDMDPYHYVTFRNIEHIRPAAGLQTAQLHH
jgi:hypothetical protein